MLLPEDRLRCAVVFAVCALAACGYVFWFLGKNQPQLRSLGSTDPTPFGRFDPQLVSARKPEVSVPGAPPVPGPAWSIGPAAGLTAICAAVLLIWPVHMGRFFGVIGVVGLCLILLTAFYALLQILAQLSDAPHVFRLLGVQRAPVVAIVLIIGILSTLFARDVPARDT
jgi:amino acid transporter